MSIYHSPRAATNGLLLSIDFANRRSYTSGTSVLDTVGGNILTLTNPTYYSFSNNTMTFNRSPSTPKTGGYMWGTMSGSLAVSSFLYSNFTWEVFFRINDVNASNYDATEGWSWICGYRGWHAGFGYYPGGIEFTMWSGPSSNISPLSWTLGTSSGNVIQGQWSHLCVTRQGDVFTKYLNGISIGTNTVSTTNVGLNTSNDFYVGGINTPNYAYLSKHTFGATKMYNRTLTAQEVLQNYLTLKGRYGL